MVKSKGKVLLTGGYLILDGYSGIVVNVNSYFDTNITQTTSQCSEKSIITVDSSEFTDCYQEYLYSKNKITCKNPNVFIQNTLLATLSFIDRVLNVSIGNLDILIHSSQDFYSQEGKKSNFIPKTKKLSDIKKTGLGSSCCLVVSLVASLLNHFKLLKSDSDQLYSSSLSLVFNLAFFIHSFSQGCVGSGFDIYCAVYGSCIYKRVPCCFDNLFGAITAGHDGVFFNDSTSVEDFVEFAKKGYVVRNYTLF